MGVSEPEQGGSGIPTAQSQTEDALTRLWKGADASHGNHVEAVAGLRERKRREQDASRSVGRRWRRGGRSGVPTGTIPTELRVSERVECERCRRTVERAWSERVAFPSPVDAPVEHLLCSRCAGEVRRGLLRLLAGLEPLPGPDQVEDDVPLTAPARVGWFAFRVSAYGLIALAVFALVTWLSVR